MAVNAPPIITPTAMSITLPRLMNSLNSLSNVFMVTPRCWGVRVVAAPDELGQAKRGGAGFRKARTYENRRAATRGDELGRGIGPASPAGS